MIDVQKLANDASDKDKVPAFHNGFWTLTHEELERFAALVLEEAAKVCDEISIEAAKQWKVGYRPIYQGREHGADECAEAIRSLKPKGEA